MSMLGAGKMKWLSEDYLIPGHGASEDIVNV